MKKLTILLILLTASLFYFLTIKVEEKGEEVNVYSSRKEELTKHLFESFTKQTGIKVNYVVDKAPKLIERIKSEGELTKADVFLTSDIGNLDIAKAQQLLQPITNDTIAMNVPQKLRDSEGYWFALSKRVRAIFYAKDRVKPDEVTRYSDLADPKWQGKLLIRSSNNIYNQSLLASIIHRQGNENARKWVQGLVKNFARKPQGGDTDQLRALAAGEGDLAVANSYYFARLLTSADESKRAVAEKIDILFPDQNTSGSHVNISGGAITKHAKNKDNAVQLLAFLTGEIAQESYAKINHEFPVNTRVNPSALVAGWAHYKLDEKALRQFPVHITEALKMAEEEGWR